MSENQNNQIKANMSDEQIIDIIKSDQKQVDEFLDGKTKTVDYGAFARVLMKSLSYEGLFKESKLCGFTRKQIENMVEKPEHFGKKIVQLSRYMYFKSGFYKKLINYFVNMAKCYWTVDLEVHNIGYQKEKPKTIQNNFIKFCAEVNKLKLENEIQNILLDVFLTDCCYGYLIENEYNSFLYYFNDKHCRISKCVDGNLTYEILVNTISDKDLLEMPQEVQDLILIAKEHNEYVIQVPYEKSLCIKYNQNFSFLYPPLFYLIGNILLIDDYKALAKAKTETEAYRLLILEIPLNQDNNQIALGDDIVSPFANLGKSIVPEQIGVYPSPMKVTPIQFKSDQSERNKVSDAKDDFYDEAGVSKDLFAGATSGAELAKAIEVDASEVYSLYRKIEKLVNFHMRMRNCATFTSYSLTYNILDITVFNQDKFIDKELRLAQASLPNKMRLAASNGINPSKLLGNQYLENDILGLGQSWTVLNSSFTQSNGGDIGGRPTKEDEEKSRITENTDANDGNNPDNRDV